MSLTNPEKVVTEERLAEFYQSILPYLGGMPDILANKFSKGDMYSTDEKMIGQWIDGKPLYQKTVVVDSDLASKSYIQIATNILDSETVVRMEALIKFIDGNTMYWRTLNHVQDNSTTSKFIQQFDPNTGAYYIFSRDDSTVTTKYHCYSVTFCYTKTTDSAVAIGSDTDYSTTEKIVGTWIDGKPIYQKTISCGALPNASTKTITHGITGIDKFIKIEGFATSSVNKVCIVLPFIVTDNASGNVALANAYITGHNNYGTFSIITGTDRSYYDESYVTLQYTKTTD